MTNQAAQFLAKLRSRLVQATEAQGKRIVADIQADVPVVSGTLRDATTCLVEDKGEVVRLCVGNTAPYAIYVEVGHLARGREHTTEVPPDPFMARSEDRERQNYVNEIKRGLR